MLDVVLLPPMDINGLFVHGGQRADKIHFANHEWPPSDINNDEIVAGDRAQTDRVRRVGLMRPMIVFPCKMEVSRFRQSCAQIGHVYISELLRWPDWQFKCRAFQMIDQHFQVVWLNKRLLRSIAEKIIRMPQNKLIQWSGRGH